MADIKIAGRIKAGAADNIAGYASEILFDDEASDKTVKEKIEEVASSPQTMIVTITPDGNDGYEADKTFAEIKAFIDNGGTVIAKDEEDGDSYYYLDNCIASEVVFTRNIWGSGGFSTRYYTIDNTNAVSFIDSVHHISSAVDSSSTANLANSAAVKTVNDALATKQDTITDLSTIRSGAAAGATAVQPAAMNTALAAKQDTLTFDNAPTANSNNPVKSGGIKTALDAKQDTISDIATIRSNAAAGATAYQKPGTGIPKTDLASAVQTSLGKADTAIQSVTVGTTTTGAAGTNASVTNTGTATEPILSFTIPQGAQGIQGIQGPQGERGPQGNTGVQVDSVASIIHSIDPTATYAAADVAGADAVQDVLSEVTELGGKLLKTTVICDDFTNAAITYYKSGVTLSIQDANTLVYSATANGSRAFMKFPVTLVIGETYIISFDYVHSYNKTVNINFGSSAGGNPAFGTTITGLSGSKTYEYTHQSGVTGFYIASTDINANNTLTLSNFTITKEDLILDVVDDIDERVVELESKQYFDIDVIEDFTNAEVSQSNSRVNISIDNGVVTVAPTAIGLRAFVEFPAGLVNDKQYVIMFDYTVSASGRTIYCNYSNAAGGISQGAFILEGTSGHIENRFTKTSAITGFYIPTSDIGANNTLTMSNFSIVRRGDAEYYIKDLNNEDTAEKENLKVLNVESEYLPFITQQYKSGVNWGGYTGSPLMGNRFGFQVVLNIASSQGAALYNETAFCLNAGGGSFGWYNIRTGASRWVNGAFTKDCPFLSSTDSGWHCNSAQFSDTFYDENDKFPLLYISGSEGTKASMFLVARIVPYNDKYTYHMELVQTVTMPPTITYANIGIENGYLYMQNGTTIYKCAAPAIFDGNGDVISTVTMTDTDILDTMTGAEHPSNPQGCCVHKGVFIGTYGGVIGNRYIATFDLFTKQPINTINTYLLGIDEEPEGVFFYKETMMLWGARNLYRLWI